MLSLRLQNNKRLKVQMKRSIYAVISLIMMVMAVGFTACGDDDNKGFSAEQIAYFEKNLEFIREKKYWRETMGSCFTSRSF